MTLETGTPDTLDAWLSEEAVRLEHEHEWANYLEATFDPDLPYGPMMEA